MRFRWIRSRFPYLMLALASLGPAGWFLSGLPIKSVDSYFSLHPQGRIHYSLYAWDARTSAGEPFVDLIAVALNGAQGVLAWTGMPLAVVQCLLLILMSSSAVLGMFMLAKRVVPSTNGEQLRDFVAACVSIAWVANPFALSFVWRHQLLIEVTWAVLPWLVLLLFSAARGSLPQGFVFPAVVLTTILGSAGFPHSYLPSLVLLGALVSAGLVVSQRDPRRALRRVFMFGLAFFAGLSWWLLPSIGSVDDLYASSEIESDSLDQLRYSSAFSGIPNVVSLTAIPALHASVGDTPYLSWSSLVTSRSGNVVRFVLPVVALVGVACAYRRKQGRGVVVALSACVVLGLLLSKGLNPPLPTMNLALFRLPLGEVFRHPVDKFSFLLVLPLCLLFGLGLHSMFAHRRSIPLGVLSAAVVCGWLALPWWSGEVVPQGGGTLPSAHVAVPDSYPTVGHELSQGPLGGKSFVLPFSPDGAAAFDWKSGIQPNLDPLLQDWAPERSLISRRTGHEFSDRVGETLSKAIADADPRVFGAARLWGVDKWVVHKDWASNYIRTPVSAEESNGFLLNPAGIRPADLVSRSTTDPIRLPLDTGNVSLSATIEKVPQAEDRLMKFGSVYLQANREGYFALSDPSRGLWNPGLPPPRKRRWHTIGIHFQNRVWLSVDGIRKGDGFPLPEPRPSSAQVLAPCAKSCGRVRLANLRTSTKTELDPVRDAGFTFAPERQLETPELGLWSQEALPLVYAASSEHEIDDRFSYQGILEAAATVRFERSPVLLDRGAISGELDPNADTTWERLTPSHYEGSVKVDGNSILVLSQSFDEQWVLRVEGEQIPESRHVLANGFANGWMIRGSGVLEWDLKYDPQNDFNRGLVAGLLMLIFSIGGLARVALQRRARKLQLGAATLSRDRGDSANLARPGNSDTDDRLAPGHERGHRKD